MRAVPPAAEALLTAILAVAGLALVVDVGALDDRVIGVAQDDKWGAMYLHEQVHRSLAAGRLPFFDDHQLFPVGAPMAAINGANVLEMLVSGLLRLAAPWPAWFNLGHLAWPPLDALAFLVLGRHLWPGDEARSTALRVSAALTWALQPVFLGEIAAGRLTQVVLVGLPLAVVALDRAAARPLGRGELAAGAVGLALTGLGYWYYAVFLALCAPVWLGVAARSGRLRGAAGDLARLGGLALLLVSPALLAIVHASLSTGVSPSLPAPPGGLSPRFDNALQLARPQPPQLQGGWVWALGPALLVTLATRAGGRWLLLAGLTTVFALGPGQLVGDRGWLLPYWPLWKVVPTLDRLTHPSRWLDFGLLFVVVAAFAGLARSAAGRRLAPLVPLGLAAQLAARGPMPTFSLPTPALWAEVARGEGALLVLPLMHAGESCRWQARHGRPVAGGMVEGLPWAWPAAFRTWFEANPLLLQLYGLADRRVTALDVRQGDIDALRADGFTQVVLDASAWRRWGRSGEADARRVLEAAFGPPRHQDQDGALWDLPLRAPPGRATPPAGVRLPPP